MPGGMEMSFPAMNLLLSNSMPKEHQCVSASLVNTTINYSISLALGIAGTVEGNVNDGGYNVLEGYRGAWYLGIGLAGTGTVIVVIFGLNDWRNFSHGRDWKENPSEDGLQFLALFYGLETIDILSDGCLEVLGVHVTWYWVVNYFVVLHKKG
jgi:hypothetical protein